ncbi:MFS transporter [Salinisphaera sp. SPP-AMP-43]|uniref:MFS transporter n=1 Tax=Salinisphaera sp. SPP-AMP-43 TaxID=3121288 RepID=UPI003C6E67B2
MKSSSIRGPGMAAILADRRARTVFSFALVGRLTYGLLPLALIFTVQRNTQSFAAAGAASAALGAATLILPYQARLIDRFGPRRVLLPVGSLFVGLLVILALASDGLGFYVFGLAGLTGACAPALGPASRHFWREWAANNEALKRSAYTLDTIGEETIFLIGPMLAGGWLAVAAPRGLLLLCALTAGLGVLGMAWQADDGGHAETRTGRQATRSIMGILREPALWPLLGVVATLAIAFGLTSLALIGRADALGGPGWAGALEAALAIGSMLGGLLWHRRARRGTALFELSGLAVLIAGGLALSAVATGFAWLASTLLLTGLAITPSFVIAYAEADVRASHRHATEAGSWINALHNLGFAGGSALGGLMIQGFSPAAAFILGSAVALITAVAALTLGRIESLARPAPGTGSE